jgi:antitoxin (DNA-binding transcriptional repressor) of toxin-antitoxin stability system
MGTVQVDMHEAGRRLPELAELAHKGERVVITKAGTPYLDLLPHKAQRKDRTPGRLAGKIRIAPDFDHTPHDVVN